MPNGTLRANGSEDSTGHAGNRSDMQPMVVVPEDALGFGYGVNADGAEEGVAPTLGAGPDGTSRQPAVVDAAAFLAGGSAKVGSIGYEDEVAPTLTSEDNGSTRTPTVVYTKNHSASDGGEDADDAETWTEADSAKTLHTMGHAPTLVVQPTGDDPVPAELAEGEPDYVPELRTKLQLDTGHALRVRAEGDPLAFNWAEDDQAQGERDYSPPVKSGTSAVSQIAVLDEGPVDEDGKPVAAEDVTAFAWQQGDDSGATGTGRGRSWVARAGDYAGALGHTRYDAVQYADVVRRLTPRECERLQGLPDDWTLLDEKTADGPRYAGLGDAVTAPVAWWVGRRILAKIALARRADAA